MVPIGLKINFVGKGICVRVCMFVHMCAICVQIPRGQKGHQIPWNRVPGGCEPASVGAGPLHSSGIFTELSL